MWMTLPIRNDNRFGGCAGATFGDVALKNPPQNFAAIDVEKLFQFTTDR
jgi:hypothetical protein